MIYCYDAHGRPIGEHEGLATIRRAAYRTRDLFPTEGFDIEDLIQEAIVRILPCVPFAHPAVLYIAAYRRLIDYHRSLVGRNHVRFKERGGRRQFHLDDLDFDTTVSREPSPGHLIEVRDEIEWAFRGMSERDQKIMEAYADKGGGSIKAAAHSLGMSPSRVNQIYIQLREYVEHAVQNRNKSLNDGPGCKRAFRVPQHSKSLDRQRAVKGLANTR